MLIQAVIWALSAPVVTANPITYLHARTQLNQDAFKEAQQRDNIANHTFYNIQIKTSNGSCLFVDPESGDFRANQTPIQTAACGSTDGQGWDITTSGKHNNEDGFILIVSTLTQACFNADPRRKPGTQVNLFSCGGRADGSGEVADSQLFAVDGKESSFRLSPQNGPGFCLKGNGGAVDIDNCDDMAKEQRFTLGASASGGDKSNAGPAAPTNRPRATNIPSGRGPTTASRLVDVPEATSTPGAVPTASPTDPVPVLRAGGTLNPSSVAEAQNLDHTATVKKKNIQIRSSDDRCLSVDPTAGDFRQNLISVALAACDQSQAGQKFDIVTGGKHNDGTLGKALIVSALTNGCISFDARRQAGDTVTIFSCGGRADGGGETDSAQLYPFDDSSQIVLEPASGSGDVCLAAGQERLEPGSCTKNEAQVFELI